VLARLAAAVMRAVTSRLAHTVEDDQLILIQARYHY